MSRVDIEDLFDQLDFLLPTDESRRESASVQSQQTSQIRPNVPSNSRSAAKPAGNRRVVTVVNNDTNKTNRKITVGSTDSIPPHGIMQQQPQKTDRHISYSSSQPSASFDLRNVLSTKRQTSLENPCQSNMHKVILGSSEKNNVHFGAQRTGGNAVVSKEASRGRKNSRSLNRLDNFGGMSSSLCLPSGNNYKMDLDQNNSKSVDLRNVLSSKRQTSFQNPCQSNMHQVTQGSSVKNNVQFGAQRTGRNAVVSKEAFRGRKNSRSLNRSDKVGMGMSSSLSLASNNNLEMDLDGDNSNKVRGERRGRGPPPTYTRFGFKRLNEMANNSDCDEIILYISQNEDIFENFLKEKPRTDLLSLLMKLVAKAAETKFTESKIYLYSALCEKAFLEHLNLQLTSFLTEKNALKFDNINNFLKNVNSFFEGVINLLPNKAVEALDNILSVEVVVLLQLSMRSNKFAETTKEAEKLQSNLDIIKESRINADEDLGERKRKLNEKPPNDFRDLSLYPTSDDFKEKNFLRENIVEGSYDDVYHYLDIQFRLLREDFIEPLRLGITHYKETLISSEARQKRNFNIKIYKKVTFIGMYYDPKKPGEISYTIQLDKKFATQIRWEYSKRLLFGSLILFTKNNFETFQLATVSDRNIKNLEKGMLNVVLVGDIIFETEIFQDEFLMAESSAFFEPVFQTLRAIKELPTDKLPMQRYILVQDISPRVPQYLPASLTIENKLVQLNDDSSWPPCETLGFNESQYSALKATMRNEFVVIQGPPGTGKTYLGLKIVKTLLKNVDFGAPILMVCYTNHALDQFLEGLLDVTTEMVRIGGQSKNEALSEFNYQVVRRKHRSMRYPGMNELKDDMSLSLANIASCNKLLEDLKTCTGILSILEYKEESKLKGVAIFEDNTDFMQWLLVDVYENLTYLLQCYKPKYENECNQPSSEQEVEDTEFIDEEELYRRRYFEAFNEVEDLEMLADVKGKVSYTLTLDKLDMIINSLQGYVFKLNEERAPFETIQAIINDLTLVKQIKDLLFERLKSSNCRPSKGFKDLLRENVWNLSVDDRWTLYHYWVGDIKNQKSREIIEEQSNYSSALQKWKEIKVMEDYSTLRNINPKILGLTTTGAARHSSLISVLKPAVIVVEEAAEVLEAHILVSLTQSCKHLILIGDHKQLKPNPSTYRIAKKFKLDVSLFERMLTNGVGCNMLNVQHRMKPNIASLIVPSIYSVLHNHPSVHLFPAVLGVVKNLFFVNHKHLEIVDSDMESKKNPHEAEFLIEFCRYLLLQGYKASDITILTTYSSQQFYLRDLKKKNSLLKEVRITVVDNYQGEECKIILLSLVRNNNENKIGFLGTENRICVALSRAKYGFYMMGNMEMLKSNSEIWAQINSTLVSQGGIGDSLSLVCQIHKEVTEVKCAKDFKNVSEGGCHLRCLRLMPCGHTCLSLCHVINVDHENVKCLQPCIKEICDLPGHSCPLRCFEGCQPCKVKMLRTIPQCGHTALIECHIKISEYKCKMEVKDVKPDCKHNVVRHCFMDVMDSVCHMNCDIRLECGHSCALKCHIQRDPDHINYQCWKDCTKKNTLCKNDHMCQKRCWEDCGLCMIKVKQTLQCGHTHHIPCVTNMEEFKCERDCKRTLPCGHPCKKLCHEMCGGCKVLVEKVIPDCGHTIKVECRKAVDRSLCRKGCTRTLPCGHKCKLKCCQDCSLNECDEYVPSPIPPACGHTGTVLCYKASSFTDGRSDELLKYCKEPCGAILPCKDICSGTCGSCMQGRIHQVCDKNCGNILICGHKCKVPCRDDCPPCREKCMYRCSHSRCNNKCGVPCVSCKEKCQWRCKHAKCNKLCGELCDRDPCYENCDLKLKCGHPCVGFCGEPCPPLCRICNKEELCEILFGTEDEDDAKFVFLNDCRHVLESSGLENWLNIQPQEGKDQEIGVKGCPKCKTPIITTVRFANAVKKSFMQVQAVKQKIFGRDHQIRDLQNKLLNENLPSLHNLIRVLPSWAISCKHLHDIITELNKIEGGGSGKGRRKQFKLRFGTNQLQLYQFIAVYVEALMMSVIEWEVESLDRVTLRMELAKKIENRFYLLVFHLSRRKNKINNAEMDQFNNEFKRFKRMIEFHNILREASSTKLSLSRVTSQIASITEQLFSVKPYDCDRDIGIAFDALAKTSEVFYQEVSRREMDSIHAAMKKDFNSTNKQGHWFQCSKGHIYTITECGGAMQEGVCPECKEIIGGSHHTLVGTSRLARVMDGANHAAWSDQQNMNNYRLL